MKSLYDNSLLFSFLLYLDLLGSQKWPAALLLCACVCWRLRTKDHSWLIVAGLLMLTLLPRYHLAQPEFISGRVVSVRANYIVVQNQQDKAILYLPQQPILDSVISFQGKWQPITSAKGFFRFDFSNWCRCQGIAYAMTSDQVTVIRQSQSLRGRLQSRINQLSDDRLKQLLLRILLGIPSSTEESADRSFLLESGFSLTGFLILMDRLLRYLLYPRQRKYVHLLLTAGLTMVFHFPLLLVQRLLLDILKLGKMRQDIRLGIGFTIILLLFPEAVSSAAFLLPAAYRLADLFSRHHRLTSSFFAMFLQGILYHSVNPLLNFFYPMVRSLLGMIFVVGMIQLLVPWTLPGQIILMTDQMLSKATDISLPGSPLGFGLLFFILICCCLRKKRHFDLYAVILFLFFQYNGLFHPLAEITFINVGQGDSILVRMPLNQNNILIDTGKPAQYEAVKSILEGKGIRRLNTLIITHHDDDHSGNQEKLAAAYHPSAVITKHQPEIFSGALRILDLNDVVSDDENQSSIVSCISLNGLRYLLMADADQLTEERIIHHYGHLRCDLLKLSHHGSKTGSSDDFLDCVRPRIAIISCGLHNIYHHPHPSVLQRLLKRHIAYLETMDEGDISVQCLPGVNFLITSAGKLGIISK